MKNSFIPKALKELAESYDVNLDGYLQWLAEREGPALLLSQKATKENNISLYKQACVREQQSFPQHIVNAGNIYKQLTSNDLGIESALKHMEDMCFPAAVYMLFAAEGYDAERFKSRAIAYCKMYPSVVSNLPEPYCEIGKALANDSTR